MHVEKLCTNFEHCFPIKYTLVCHTECRIRSIRFQSVRNGFRVFGLPSHRVSYTCWIFPSMSTASDERCWRRNERAVERPRLPDNREFTCTANKNVLQSNHNGLTIKITTVTISELGRSCGLGDKLFDDWEIAERYPSTSTRMIRSAHMWPPLHRLQFLPVNSPQRTIRDFFLYYSNLHATVCVFVYVCNGAVTGRTGMVRGRVIDCNREISWKRLTAPIIRKLSFSYIYVYIYILIYMLIRGIRAESIND